MKTLTQNNRVLRFETQTTEDEKEEVRRRDVIRQYALRTPTSEIEVVLHAICCILVKGSMNDSK